MPKQGFKNQWVAISRKGKVADSTGIERDLSEDFLKTVVANFTPNNAPAVVGHPKDNNPAFGWVSALRFENGSLEAQFADTDDAFEQMCADGKFRKRSASFYLGEKPSLRHVGFLGAMPPAVKGLRDIQFNDGDSVTVEISFNEEENATMKDELVEKVADSLFSKFTGLFKTETAPSIIPPAAPTTASFSEADAKKLVEEALAENTKTLTAQFNEKYAALETTVNTMTGSSKRAEIVSFVENIPAEKGKYFLKNVGIVEFMEALAKDDEGDKEPAVVCFSEADGKKEEHKFSRLDYVKTLLSSLPVMIEFGESFGSLKATSEVGVLTDANRTAQINAELGLGGDK